MFKLKKFVLINVSVFTEEEISQLKERQVIIVSPNMIQVVKEYKRKFLFLY